MIYRTAALAALTFGLSCLAWADMPMRIPHEIYQPPESGAAEQSQPRSRRIASPPSPAVMLPPLDAEESQLLREDAADGRRQRIGVNRAFASYVSGSPDAATLEWRMGEAGGWIGEMALGSEGASALRSRIRLERAPLGSRFVVSGNADPDTSITLGLAQVASRPGGVWTPLTIGDIQLIAIEMPPGAASEDVAFQVTELSHIELDGQLEPRRLSDVGDGLSCHVDENCHADPMIQLMADAVVKMLFTDFGGSFLCTGNLLGDSDTTTSIPYFYTAAHCISSQSAAATLQTYWKFQSTACNSGRAASFDSRTGGAQLLYTNSDTDVTLLRLNDQPPAGSVFSGWEVASLVLQQAVVSAHHPAGDLKKISFGDVIGFRTPNQFSGDDFIRVSWNTGITQSGSSGGGLFTVDSSSFYFRGGLWGGSSNCSNTDGPDFYSRFDRAFAHLREFLSPDNFTVENGWWWNPEESGRGFNIEIRNGTLFFGGFLYADDGRATWVTASGPMSGSNNFRGSLQQFANGQTLTGAYKAPVQTSSPGDISLQFTAADQGTLIWPGGTVPIQRFRFSQGSRSAGLTPERGWWWNSAESGRGFGIESQGDLIFVSGYMYDEQGNPVWYLASGTLDAANVFRGNWTRYAGGQTLTGAYQAPTVVNADAGAVTLQFLSTTGARLTLPDNRVIDLTRFEF